MEKERKARAFSIKREFDRSPVILCSVVTVIAVACAVAGLIMKKPVIIAAGLLPAAFYEAYRTWGIHTKTASIALLCVIVLEIILILFGINFDLARFLGTSSKYIAGHSLPLGDIKTVAPALVSVLAVILIIRTAGPYTKWLAAVLIAGCFCLVYALSPEQFPVLLKWGINQALRAFSVLVN
ncbi:MAG TPA: hypothetical protein P5511_05525 [Candidatus Goldiibacteriota bacterium]|nr:hypothetical protein [Candidatus Goldiibacteriota bacterium]